MLQALQHVFSLHARESAGQEEQASHGDNGSRADGLDRWTLEYTFDRFKNFMRKLERVAATDPREALNLARTSLTDRVFTAPAQVEKIERKVRELEMNSPEKSIEDAFSRSVLSLSPRTAPQAMELQPVVQNLIQPLLLRASPAAA